MATNAYDIIKRPIVTEQSMEQTEMKRYTFEVAKSANKIEIAKAVEEIFGVKVSKVNTLNMQGKEKRTGAYPKGRRPSWKKAMVTLTEDSKSIELFEGMV
ncbi:MULTISPECIES: 50S ribosomal protein L23 [Oscillospiraceae]|uniref:Large ribosomal subunit protein uL23 n=1 Tax=Lawsonibacter faecis TaxID=2763052 RepID=A0A8J6JP27_9FIRM|nr:MULTISPECIES: 50S ribosomal protein L23 [Oscillospiraceae]MTQ96298.1 50S ribosomal protein L23 [Pseudoflavonifractor sp. BIOML-A16]MTR06986.1 50S ribosomal protein L23 [Pseudoflavonifractor sp. BIOML-A15]MTR32137.1 50S ribosomal protein L23 [Pseudoflavonifractor sp. BIOML-A14]MTR73710.1 50S ribosomal protein L23 [Pseudoflavonifractor sp. BIOML-A18]MTS65287.1 50S ribosomal protein L23 [Pseudoflavonifractor sp. BIOML-A5]MTS71093.1 50S ribosomal protein L23 [Pseudoflavonifractor sp. BIOML-A8]